MAEGEGCSRGADVDGIGSSFEVPSMRWFVRKRVMMGEGDIDSKRDWGFFIDDWVDIL